LVPLVGAAPIGRALSTFAKRAPEAIAAPMWLNGAPGLRIDVNGVLDTVMSLVIENGRITRLYAIRNPHKLARLHAEAPLSRQSRGSTPASPD
jgi:hypothetical protein